eukprot:880592_1
MNLSYAVGIFAIALKCNFGLVHSQGIKDPEFFSPKKNGSFCRGNFVQCRNGTAPGGASCEDACNGECCVEDNACTEFTGIICKDSVSCVGTRACFRANIQVVSKGCNGDRACMGQDTGPIGLVHQSCLGDNACFPATAGG